MSAAQVMTIEEARTALADAIGTERMRRVAQIREILEDIEDTKTSLSDLVAGLGIAAALFNAADPSPDAEHFVDSFFDLQKGNVAIVVTDNSADLEDVPATGQVRITARWLESYTDEANNVVEGLL